MKTPLETLRHHVTGAIERGEAVAIVEQRAAPETFTYSKWRHGGWYVHGVRYPSGAIGCVSRNYADRKWRIACDSRPFEQRPTFPNRDAAALAEWHMAQAEFCQVKA